MPEPLSKFFYESQRLWIRDNSPLKLCVKSHQTGFSWCNCYRLIIHPRLITRTRLATKIVL